MVEASPRVGAVGRAVAEGHGHAVGDAVIDELQGAGQLGGECHHRDLAEGEEEFQVFEVGEP